jgi:hypothetical protein
MYGQMRFFARYILESRSCLCGNPGIFAARNVLSKRKSNESIVVPFSGSLLTPDVHMRRDGERCFKVDTLDATS